MLYVDCRDNVDYTIRKRQTIVLLLISNAKIAIIVSDSVLTKGERDVITLG